MRHVFHLCLLLLLLLCGGAKAGAKVNDSVRKTFVSWQKWQERKQDLPERTIETPHNQVVTPIKSESRDGAGTFREYFLPRIPFFLCKVQASRLLPDVHAIIRSLLFPQHIFW
ncbi:hypothetical protein [Chitinophaga tropicalis]|uniref:Uncharacterized protein n=1 Tax=Chitinophaga tropicalis TaxID=2683588 RepID=A0A7K1UCU4_9BACT|nr:hypothetical protein [Chitinophaga tropicalis]MVT12197.1 hypothetical protein [Chitinophaga tropicalis]